MEKSLSEILSAIPPKRPRSKLEPHYDLIRELRRRSNTYREIARILQDHVGLKVDHTTIRDFVCVRARWAKTPRLFEQLPPRTFAKGEPGSETELRVRAPTTPAAPGSRADPCARIEALKRRKPTPESADPGFHFEEGAPLRLISDPTKKD